jgi:phosphonate ABC transporter permease subunit PhnE
MTTPENTLISPDKSFLPSFLSLVIPGAGQFFFGRRGRGIIIFLVTIITAYLINWSLVDLNIAKVTLGGNVTTWLWIPFVLLWAWNVLDSRRFFVAYTSNNITAVLLVALIVYTIAWNVTDVKLDRLVTRIEDAKTVFNKLINPELATVVIDGQDQVCSWGCVFNYERDRIAGVEPKYPVRVSDNLLDIFGKVTKENAPTWMVSLGLARKDQQIFTFVAGKMVETLAIGLMATLFSTLLAVPVSFLAAHNIMSRFPGGQAIYYITRGILNIIRAVDTVVWGLIVIVWVGLGTFAGVIALTIHSIAALGKLFSEEIEHIDPGPVEALTATGANLIQTIRFGVIPQVIPSFLAYTLLRWDINMRSATVVGIVAGGGIGFFVLEAIRAGGYQQYATALWAVAIVIILVDYISAKLRENILKDQPREVTEAERPLSSKLSRAFKILVGALLIVYFWNAAQINLKDLFQPAPTFLRLVGDFISIDLSKDVFDVVLQQMLVTIFQALLATTFGALIALPFSFLAAKNLTGNNPILVWLYVLTRSVFNILRSIEALLYVAIFIFWVGIGPFAGMLALAVTSFALIGKLFSEAIENIEPGSIEATTATGANALQTIRYAILPQIIPPFVSYLIYQWDINIRMATIIGFAGGGGIGLTLSTFFGSLQYHKAGTVVAFIVVVVAFMDFASAKVREQLV